ncbi:MAG: HFLK protein [Firmicutes bacterium HGW-Firmicutes-16]|nr:MAG: HFLK protein [Firmicutes bacterium HGW-Firmicutes-16]
MAKGDFGYFGKGLNGYIHYQVFQESQKGGGGGGRKPSQNSGCLTMIGSILGAALLLVILFAY